MIWHILAYTHHRTPVIPHTEKLHRLDHTLWRTTEGGVADNGSVNRLTSCLSRLLHLCEEDHVWTAQRAEIIRFLMLL
jgi:hypothetical protein